MERRKYDNTWLIAFLKLILNCWQFLRNNYARNVSKSHVTRNYSLITEIKKLQLLLQFWLNTSFTCITFFFLIWNPVIFHQTPIIFFVFRPLLWLLIMAYGNNVVLLTIVHFLWSQTLYENTSKNLRSSEREDPGVLISLNYCLIKPHSTI